MGMSTKAMTNGMLLVKGKYLPKKSTRQHPPSLLTIRVLLHHFPSCILFFATVLQMRWEINRSLSGLEIGACCIRKQVRTLISKFKYTVHNKQQKNNKTK